MAVVTRPIKPVGGGGGDAWIAGARLTATELNSEYLSLLNDYNGNITDANISASAGIQGSKLASAPNGVPAAKINDGAIDTIAKIANNILTQGKMKVTLYTGFVIPASIGAGSFAAANTGFTTAKVPMLVYIEMTNENVSGLKYLALDHFYNLTTNSWWITLSAPNGTGTYTKQAGDAVKAIFLDV